MKAPVRNLLAVLLIGSSLSASATAGDYLKWVTDLSCPETFPSWVKQLKAVEKDAAEFSAKLTVAQSEAKTDFKERDVMFVTLLWPAQLKKSLNYYRMFEDCAELHWKLLRKPSKDAHEAWKNCVIHGYGRDGVPEVFDFLRACYDKLL